MQAIPGIGEAMLGPPPGTGDPFARSSGKFAPGLMTFYQVKTCLIWLWHMFVNRSIALQWLLDNLAQHVQKYSHTHFCPHPHWGAEQQT